MTERNQTDYEEPQRISLPLFSCNAKSRKRLGIISLSVLAVISMTAAGISLGITAITISRELESTDRLASELKDDVLRDDADAAAATLAALQDHTRAARQAASDPLWTMAGTLPWVGSNIQAITTVATSADDVAKLSAGPLVRVFASLNWGSFAPNEKGINLAPLIAARPDLVSAAHAVNQSSERLNSLDANSLLPQISAPLKTARDRLTSLRGGLDAAADVATIAPSMLGATAPRRYLVLVQNNAESRASGGIPGALAVLGVDNGKLTLTSQTSATALGVMSPTVPVEPEQQLIYSRRMGKFMQDVNLSPDFPSSAAIAHAMWGQKTGQKLDGVISIDPIALSYLLEATGPVRLTDPELNRVLGAGLPTELTSKNVVPTLLSEVYAQIPEPAIQDLYFAGVAKEIFDALSRGTANSNKLIAAASKGVDAGRILVWSAAPGEQSVISKYGISGSISGRNISAAQFGVYFNDGTGAKMDYYMKRTARLIKTCTNNGYVEVKVRVTSTNNAPIDAATSLPAYVTGAGAFGVAPGTVQTNIVAYGPVQSRVESAVADGQKISFASQTHSGRPVGTVTVALPPGKSSTVEILFGKIVQHAKPELSVTPTVQGRGDVVLDTVTEKCAPAS